MTKGSSFFRILLDNTVHHSYVFKKHGTWYKLKPDEYGIQLIQYFLNFRIKWVI